VCVALQQRGPAFCVNRFTKRKRGGGIGTILHFYISKYYFFYVIILFMKGSPIRLKQKLSPKAAAAKKRRDIAMAKTTARKAKKAENQRLGQRSNSDIHHMPDGKVKRVSIKNNRGNFGRGTKNE